ncbi:MAG TPA: helix-turn-helix domain-containing protein [Candidatus Saccharimonadales bacterium]|nr:helix-turn-helix domain-containing protein [Candidatus Saccharimonadales bacterium]
MPDKKRKMKAGTGQGSFPEEAVHTLTSLEQMKTIADPLRIRLLESFMLERTTKQVADLLGERPTKLYHHVDALEKVGLIRLARTRQNRGTVEKYYQAVARSFRAAPRLFGSDKSGEKKQAMRSMLSTIFDGTSSEMQRLLTTKCGPKDFKETGLLSYVELRASDEKIRQFREELEKLVTRHGVPGKRPASTDKRRYRLTIAFFPLDRFSDKPEE